MLPGESMQIEDQIEYPLCKICGHKEEDHIIENDSYYCNLCIENSDYRYDSLGYAYHLYRPAQTETSNDVDG